MTSAAKKSAHTQANAAVYIEDVFSTWLYTGNGSTQTITNGIDLSGKGGLVWIKRRNGIRNHALIDTGRGASVGIATNTTDGNTTYSPAVITSFGSTGFSLNSNIIGNNLNDTYSSWSFREQSKFFDVVTYTGNGVGGRNINHNLGSAPGCIIIKCTSTTSNWMVWHRSISGQDNLRLNTTDSVTGVTDPISVPGFPGTLSTTQFTVDVGTGDDLCNVNGATYVAYLFAHDAGGFGLTGSDNVVSCGTYTGNGSTTGTSVTLGYEPQWLLIKRTDTTADWNLIDNMRGFVVGGTDAELNPNLSNAESTGTFVTPTSTGFQLNTTDAEYNASSGTYIYIAIRRPMKVPTTGTSVFSPQAGTGSNSSSGASIGFPADLFITASRNDTYGYYWYDRLRGSDGTSLLYMTSTATNGEASAVDNPQALGQDTIIFPSNGGWWNSSARNFSRLNFRRATGFFDEVCYTGTGTARDVTHNLGAVPELMIIKRRNSTTGGVTYSTLMSPNKIMELFSNFGSNASLSEGSIINTDPTSTTFNVRTDTTVNGSGATYVAYLFASCTGVSKVGVYTGNGSNQTINCGFTGGARFVMIKRTDSSGDWYVWDTARGIVANNDPHLSLNATAAEVTTDDSVDTDNSGFIVNQVSATNINVSNATYLYFAIA